METECECTEPGEEWCHACQEWACEFHVFQHASCVEGALEPGTIGDAVVA